MFKIETLVSATINKKNQYIHRSVQKLKLHLNNHYQQKHQIQIKKKN